MSEKPRRPLPSFDGASRTIGTFLAGLEQQILHKRPAAAVVAEEHDRAERSSLNGVTVHLPDEPIDRPEPPDTTGARL
jgi:hypothetical protein